MSSVLPIDTQRYQSGDYTLEVTAHPSPLSQWSDRTVVRQLRFSLWSEQPERQRLAAGNQRQLIIISDAVETYVQRHLTQQAWPQTHRLMLLDQEIEFSTLQLFDLAEVLNAYGQRQITLPARQQRPHRRHPRRQWWTGSAVASMLVAVGVTTAYLYYRPAAVQDAVTTQVPDAVFEDGAFETFEDKVAVFPEANTQPGASSVPAAPALESAPVDDLDSSAEFSFESRQELAQQPLDQTTLESVRIEPQAVDTEAGANAGV